MKKYMRGHIGEVYKTNEGYNCEVINGGSKNRFCTIKIENKNGIFTREYHIKSIKAGNVKNPYHPSVRGLGFFGVGKHRSRINKKKTRKYKTWVSMFDRCYVDKEQWSTYKNTVVCEKWHNYQVFGDWFDDNYYKIDNCKMHLDKDLLGNSKLYSPDNCVFIPQKLNNFITKSKNTNKTGYIGISIHSNGKFQANIGSVITGETLYLGLYDNMNDALSVYNKAHNEQVFNIIHICKYKWHINNEKLIEGLYGLLIYE